MGRPPGYVVLGVLNALAENEEMTNSEICVALGIPKTMIGAVLHRMSKPLASVPKRIYIVRYVYDDDTSSRRYPRAVYALGDEPDALKPKREARRLVAKRYRLSVKTKVNSIFQLAQSRRSRKAERDALKEAA